jgi:8-oxo-dGTP pyrophosphatase MutT (NUDIX family)
MLDFPGGLSKPGESPEKTASREVFEETNGHKPGTGKGLRLNLKGCPSVSVHRSTNSKDGDYKTFVSQITQAQFLQIKPSHEHHFLGLVAKDDLIDAIRTGRQVPVYTLYSGTTSIVSPPLPIWQHPLRSIEAAYLDGKL